MPMRCRNCGARGAVIGRDREWTPLNDAATPRRLYECHHCGHRQHRRGARH
ncbi:hypothetical protein [Halosimplex halobium]|uniref:hypothetical protein n=1 Tax=Halosimplex halobium TaxID=3396618 RepID=UPI003F56D6D8